MSRRLMLRNASGGGGILPPEYQRVEWIGYNRVITDGNTINLPIRAYEADVVEIELAKLTVPTNGTIAVTTTAGGSGNWALLETDSNNKWTPNPSSTRTETFSYKKVVFTRKETATATAYLCIGYFSPKFVPEVHFMSYKIQTGANVVYNGVPCYRKSDNEIGMYDTVSNSFSGGSGFLKGADV